MRKNGILLMFLLLLIPMKVNALTGNINMSCSPSVANTNGNIVCNITGTSDEEVSAFSANIGLSSNLEYVDFKADPIWIGDASSNLIGLYTDENKIGTFNIGVLTVKVKDNVFDRYETISLVNCLYSTGAPDYSKVPLTVVSNDIKVASSNNKLSSLEVLPGTISFNPDTLNYSINVDSSSVNISAVAEDDNASISGDIGSKSLNYGSNIFKVYVTGENKSVRTYTITVVRNDNRSTENKLSSLTIGGQKINFNENVYNYNLTVGYEITSIKINANLKDSKSYYIKGYEPGTKNLKEGLNKFEIRVSAENGSVKTYTINVTRKEDPDNTSDDNYLDSLKTDTGTLNFSKEQEEYKMTVPYDTDSIKIDTVVSSNKSKVEVSGNDNLQVGENIITIRVTSANGDVREYRIIVTKKDKEVILSNNNYLKSLEISNYNIKFNKETLSYKLKIKDEDMLDIMAIADDVNANVTIKNNKDLKNKSVISINVTAEDGSTREYKINIAKKVEINYLLIAVIIETIVIIGVVLYFIIKKRKNDQYEEF